jgi:hypothetical protein
MIRRILVISDGKPVSELVGGISWALMVTGWVILISLRIMIPVFTLAAGPVQMEARLRRDLTMDL